MAYSISISCSFTLVTTATNFLLTKMLADEEPESKYGTIMNDFFRQIKINNIVSMFSVSRLGSGLIACKA